jgi:hypothetical protein
VKATLACIISYLALCVAAHASDVGLTREQFVAALQSAQDNVKNVEFTITTRERKIDSTGAIQDTPYYYRAHVITAAPFARNWRMEIESALRWYPNSSTTRCQTAVTYEEYAFNGRICTWQQRTSEKGQILHQAILPQGDHDKIAQISSTHFTGFDVIAPLYKEMGIAEYLRQLPAWQLSNHGQGLYTADGGRGEVTIDLSRGGNITAMSGDFVLPKSTIDEYRGIVLKQYGDTWFPESAVLWRKFDEFKVSFEKVTINQELPKDTFAIKFDGDFQVWDRRTGIKYLANGPFGWFRYVSMFLVGLMTPAGGTFAALMTVASAVLIVVRRRQRQA